MTTESCPACGMEVAPDQERCEVCGALLDPSGGTSLDIDIDFPTDVERGPTIVLDDGVPAEWTPPADAAGDDAGDEPPPERLDIAAPHELLEEEAVATGVGESADEESAPALELEHTSPQTPMPPALEPDPEPAADPGAVAEAPSVAAAASALDDPPISPTASFSEAQQRHIAFLRESLAESPEDVSLVLELARVHEEAADRDGADFYYERAVEIDPRNPIARARLEKKSAAVATGPAPEADRSAPAERASAPVPSRARPSKRGGRKRGGARLHPAVIGGLAALPILAIAIWLIFFPTSFWFSSEDLPTVAPKFSPDGSTLAAVGLRNGGAADRAFGVVKLPSEGQLMVHRASRRGRLEGEWRPQMPQDGPVFVWGGTERLAFTSRNRNVTVIDLDRPDRTERTFEASTPSFSPDGQKLAFEARAQKKKQGSSSGYGGGYGYGYGYGYGDYDDSYLSHRTGNQAVHVHDFARNQTSQITEKGARRPAWSPDGQLIAYEVDEFAVEKRKRVYRWGNYTHEYFGRVAVWKGTRIEVVPSAGGDPVVVAQGGVNRYAAWPPGGSTHLTWLHWEHDRTPEAEEARKPPVQGDVDVRLAGPSLMRGRADGMANEELLSFGIGAVALHQVAWTPSGTGVVYTGLTVSEAEAAPNGPDQVEAAHLLGKVDLFYLDLNSGFTARLSGGGSRMDPAISPDGKRIAWVEVVEEEPKVHVTRWSSVKP